MESIKVDKKQLLDVLKKNRREHHEIFLEAQDGYRRAIVMELDAMLQDARNGKKIRRSVTLVEPVDQTRDYDRVIRMMEMSIETAINLSEHEFQSYVLDDWNWKKQFNASNFAYSAKLAATMSAGGAD